MKPTLINNPLFYLRTPKNYPEDSDCFEVVWKEIFMPFDIIKGLDGCPPDNNNYKRNKKNHWWVCPKTKKDMWDVHDIKMFIRELPPSQEFSSLDKAVKFCLKWRKEWLESELKKTVEII